MSGLVDVDVLAGTRIGCIGLTGLSEVVTGGSPGEERLLSIHRARGEDLQPSIHSDRNANFLAQPCRPTLDCVGDNFCC